MFQKIIEPPKYLHHERPICMLALFRPQHPPRTPPITPDSLGCWVCTRLLTGNHCLRPTARSVALTWPCTNKKQYQQHRNYSPAPRQYGAKTKKQAKRELGNLSETQNRNQRRVAAHEENHVLGDKGGRRRARGKS